MHRSCLYHCLAAQQPVLHHTHYRTYTLEVSNHDVALQAFTFCLAGVGYLFVEKPFMNLEVLVTSRLRRAWNSCFCAKRPERAAALVSPRGITDTSRLDALGDLGLAGELNRSLLIQ